MSRLKFRKGELVNISAERLEYEAKYSSLIKDEAICDDINLYKIIRKCSDSVYPIDGIEGSIYDIENVSSGNRHSYHEDFLVLDKSELRKRNIDKLLKV